MSVHAITAGPRWGELWKLLPSPALANDARKACGKRLTVPSPSVAVREAGERVTPLAPPLPPVDHAYLQLPVCYASKNLWSSTISKTHNKCMEYDVVT